jgi:hypothetical protein
VVGIAYFYFFLFRPRGRRGRGEDQGQGFPGFAATIAQGRVLVELGAAVLGLVVVALAWIWPGTRKPALPFSRADVQFLFTAPISRRRLVRYRVLRSQIGTLFGSAIMTLIFRPTSLAGGWTFFVGMALGMAIVNLHLTGVSLNRAHAGEGGLSGLARRWVPVAIVVAILGIIGGTLASHQAQLAAIGAQGGDVLEEIERLGTTGLAGAVLWPFRMIARLPFAQSVPAFFAALPWALAALWLNYVWVLRTDVAFEEASAELSEKLARVRKEGLSALRPPRKATTTPFVLAAEGPAETAILWKNLILMGRFLSWRLLFGLAPMLVMFAFAATRAAQRGAMLDLLTVASLFVAGFTVLVGPQLVRSDLRQDLANLAVLKTWPLRGATIVRGEVLAPAIVLSAVAGLALVMAAALSANPTLPIPAANRWALLLAALAVVPGVVLAQLLVQNALAVTFPAWTTIGTPQRGGIDVMGQRLLMMVANLIALALALVPAALVGAAAALAGWALIGTVPVLVPAILAGGTLQAEAFLATEMIGAMFDRTDVAALDAPDT